MYSLTSLGVATISEAIGGIIAFYIVDVKNLPVTWYSTFWFFYTIYNAFNNPAPGYLSDRTRTRWGRRILYPIHGRYLSGIRETLEKKREMASA